MCFAMIILHYNLYIKKSSPSSGGVGCPSGPFCPSGFPSGPTGVTTLPSGPFGGFPSGPTGTFGCSFAGVFEAGSKNRRCFTS